MTAKAKDRAFWILWWATLLALLSGQLTRVYGSEHANRIHFAAVIALAGTTLYAFCKSQRP